MYVKSIPLLNAQGGVAYEDAEQDSHVVMVEAIQPDGVIVVINPDRRRSGKGFTADKWGRMTIGPDQLADVWCTTRVDGTHTKFAAVAIARAQGSSSSHRGTASAPLEPAVPGPLERECRCADCVGPLERSLRHRGRGQGGGEPQLDDETYWTQLETRVWARDSQQAEGISSANWIPSKRAPAHSSPRTPNKPPGKPENLKKQRTTTGSH
jgi:hypothetical protein